MSDKQNVFVLNLSSYTQPEIIENGRDEWVEYGEDNNYYQWLIDRYRNSPTNNAIINNIARLIYGKGLKAKDARFKPNDYANMVKLFNKSMLRSVILDYKILGSGAMQVIYSKNRKMIERVEHIPMHLLRPEKCNEDGEIENYYYSDNWEDTKKFPPKPIPVFGTSNQELELIVFGNYSIGRKYFYGCDYEGSLDYALLEERIGEYLINEVQNGFSGTKVINFNNGGGTEEQQRLLASKVKGQLTGSRGDKVIVSFNDNAESKTTVDDIPLNDAPDHYKYLSEECRNKILVGHNVTSPMLVGISPDGQGFSSNADEIEVASKYFYNTVIKALQEPLLDAIDSILSYNDVFLDIYFERLDTIGDITKNVAMSEHKMDDVQLFESLVESPLGEEWELVDSRPVDYDTEEALDAELRALNNPKESLLAKIWNFVSTGTARPNAKSEQDGAKFKSRYRYTGEISADSREFCSKMIEANKIYRKEDILKMESQAVNAGWGPKGADNYSIWLYKGGGNCKHFWTRETYRLKSDVNNPLAEQISPAKARKEGEILPTNDKKVYQKPFDMPNRGFLPK